MRYLLIELLTAILFVAVGIRFGYSELLPAYLFLTAGLIILSAIDLELFLLPNRVVYPTGLLVGAGLAGATLVTGDYNLFWRSLACGVGAFLLFFVVHAIYPKGMGFGDVRLSFVLGMSMGYLGISIAFAGFFGAFLLGSIVGLGVMVTGRGRQVPFGPFLASGTMAAILWGQTFVDWYVSRSGIQN